MTRLIEVATVLTVAAYAAAGQALKLAAAYTGWGL